MDSLQELLGQPEDENASEEESLFEAPPEIGADERRMHVRAYNYWVSLLDGRAFPSIEDLEPEEIHDFGPNSVLLDFTCGSQNPAIAYLGAALREECGLRGDMQTTADIPSRSLLSRLTDHYLQIIANGAPIGFEAEFVSRRGANALYRGILMPFSSDGDTIDFVYGVINWKEVLDAPAAEGLAREVGRATEHVIGEPGPVWADGPNGADFDEQDARDTKRDDVADLVLDPDAALADRLSLARQSADAARGADARSRTALYRALGYAYDVALAAEAAPDDYAEILSDAGLKAQQRAPMTPIVKLVFGLGYDKARVTEFAAALAYGRRQALALGSFAAFLEEFEGGLKAVVAAERAARRTVPARNAGEAARATLRRAPALAHVEMDIGPADFVLLVARRESDGRLAVVAPIAEDKALIERALRKGAACAGQ